jgi:transposase
MGNPRGVRRDFQALEKRRLAAVKLFGEDFNNSEIGRRLKVCNQTVSRWRKQYCGRREIGAPQSRTGRAQYRAPNSTGIRRRPVSGRSKWS